MSSCFHCGMVHLREMVMTFIKSTTLNQKYTTTVHENDIHHITSFIIGQFPLITLKTKKGSNGSTTSQPPSYGWWFRNPANQFSPVVYPIIYVLGGSPDCFTISCINDWLVVSTHLKKYESKWESSPNFRGENTKYLSCHHLDDHPTIPSHPPSPSHHCSSGFLPCLAKAHASITEALV